MNQATTKSSRHRTVSNRIEDIIDFDQHPLDSERYRASCKHTLDRDGVLMMQGFLQAKAIEAVRREGIDGQSKAFYTASNHNIYLKPADPDFPSDHPRNKEIVSSKGCITTDQIDKHSALHSLYNAHSFRKFLCCVLGEKQLYEYADPLSSINLHYAAAHQELGWHFDNSSFAITLMIQEPNDGGKFEYIKDVRDAERGEMNYEYSARILAGEVETTSLAMQAGTLVLFRGRNSIHRVTPVIGERTRMLVVLAYNTEPGVSLSESARMTFYGRLG